MKELPLPHGLFALIDDEEFERCSQFKWHVGKRGYAVRRIRTSDGWANKYLHQFIMNAPAGVCVDHIHGNKLDNRKSELRFGTQQQNCCNRGKQRNNTSGFKGVSWFKAKSKWRAQIEFNGKQVNLGYFTDLLEAAAAYATAAKKHHGEFARTTW